MFCIVVVDLDQIRHYLKLSLISISMLRHRWEIYICDQEFKEPGHINLPTEYQLIY